MSRPGCLSAPDDEEGRVAIDGIEDENQGSTSRSQAVSVRNGSNEAVFGASVTVEPAQSRALDPGLDATDADAVTATADDDHVEGAAAAFADGDACGYPLDRVTGQGDLGLTAQSVDDC